MKPKLESSFVWLKKRFIYDKKTLQEIALEAGCSTLTVRRRLKEFGLIR